MNPPNIPAETALANIFRLLAERGRRVRMATTAKAGESGQAGPRPNELALEAEQAEEGKRDNG